MNDNQFMRLVLRLAKKGMGSVSPNPMVGAVIVKDQSILSTGYHEKYGSAHAEPNALGKLSRDETFGATCYVNLEPCCHTGKTPPCTEQLIDAGISRVVIGMKDPNPLVAGNGIQRLKDAGIKVESGILREECLELNKAFVKYISEKRPYVTIKMAQTLDGKIALENGQSKWISSEKSRNWVQRLRQEHDGILVGIETVLNDNPRLTRRKGKKTGLKRVVLDSSLRIPLESQILSDDEVHNTVIVCTDRTDQKKIDLLREKNIKVIVVKPDARNKVDLKQMLNKLAEDGMASLLVEGGSEVATSFLKKRLADRLLLFIAPKLFGNGLPAVRDLGVSEMDQVMNFFSSKWTKSGPDIVFDGRF